MLLVHPSGFYAWLREPLSQRALEHKRQTKLIKTAWKESGEVCGYRKLQDDLCDHGEDISPNRAWRSARLAGIRALIGYKKKPGSYGGSPAVVTDKTLNRGCDVDAPDQFRVTGITYIRTPDGFLYSAVVIDLFSRRFTGWAMQGRTPPRPDDRRPAPLLAACNRIHGIGKTAVRRWPRPSSVHLPRRGPVPSPPHKPQE